LAYYTRAAAESNSDSLDASQRLSQPYSSVFLSGQPSHVSPPPTGVSGMRNHFSSHGSPENYHASANTPELRSPASFVDDDPTSGSMRSRSQSPHVGDEGNAQTGRVPRPPNAWILYRSVHIPMQWFAFDSPSFSVPR
jgi:hypothetical protein